MFQSSRNASASTTVTFARSATTSRSAAGDATVDLDRGDRRSRLGERHGQRTEPCADLDDMIVGPDVGQAGDLANDVGVDDEVLAEIAARRQAVFARAAPRCRGASARLTS